MVDLVHDYRGNVIENTHVGRICVVDAGGKIACSAGDPEAATYYRSTSKPLQALPVLIRGLDKKYGLTDREVAILAGSHAGEDAHVEVLLSLLDKTGFSENDLITPLSMPAGKARDDFSRMDAPPRKLLHNCAGKHIAAMMLAKELTGDNRDYWRPECAAQQEIKNMIAYMAAYPAASIEVGIDGCGIPVFAVPLRNMAVSYARMACPDTLDKPEVAVAAARMSSLMNENPLMVRGAGYLCSVFNEDPNVVAKGGSDGVYGFGLKKERLGVALKIEDSSEHAWPIIITEILRQLNYDNAETAAKLDKLAQRVIYNDSGVEVGMAKPVFKLEI